MLLQVGLPPDRIVAAHVDETGRAGELPRALAMRLALAKAKAVAGGFPGAVVLAADTVVARGRRVLAKPANEDEARQCLQRLSGATHRVHGGVAVIAADGRDRCRLVTTMVTFKRLDRDEIAGYLASGEWRDRAGGYAIQGRAAAFVRRLNGSYSNVVGLPLFETVALLKGLGLQPEPAWTAGDDA